jgi:hypothetical protein
MDCKGSMSCHVMYMYMYMYVCAYQDGGNPHAVSNLSELDVGVLFSASKESVWHGVAIMLDVLFAPI